MDSRTANIIAAVGGAAVLGAGAFLLYENRNKPPVITPNPTVAPLVLTTTSLGSATQGQPYSFTLTATGGVSPYTFSASGLPSGLSINSSTGKISGTPTVSGSFSVLVAVQDTSGQKVTATFSLSVAAQAQQTSTLTVPTQDMGSATVGKPYSYQLQASGGSTPYTWYVSGLGGTGLSATSSGYISGTPTAAGTLILTLEVMDSQGHKAVRTTQFTIKAASTVAPVIPMQSLPTLTVGQPFAYQWKAQGTGPFTWNLEGTIPGVTMSTSGLMSGTPTTAQGSPFSVVVTVTDAYGNRASRSTLVYVHPAASSSGGSSSSPAPYIPAWTQNCQTQLLDAAGNPVSGVSPYAVNPQTGGTADFGGYTYTWPPCPYASSSSGGSSGSSGSTSSAGGSSSSSGSSQALSFVGWTTGCQVQVSINGNVATIPPLSSTTTQNGGTITVNGQSLYVPPCPYAKPTYTPSWTSSCQTVLLDVQGNEIVGVSPYAASPATGGTGYFDGVEYTWPPCPYYHASSGSGSTSSAAPYSPVWLPGCKTALVDAQGNYVSGFSPYAVNPKTGGTGYFGGYAYTWPPCPYES